MPVNTLMITSASRLTTAVALTASPTPDSAASSAHLHAVRRPIFSPIRCCTPSFSSSDSPDPPALGLPSRGPSPALLGGLLPPMTKEDFSNLLSPFFGSNSSVADLQRLEVMEKPRTHLLVLVHGITGQPDDLGYIKRVVEWEVDAGKQDILVHATDVNAGKTQDGVEAGGDRVAQDIRDIVHDNPSLSKISLIGFSLGGLYTRYAIARLFSRDTCKIAGLHPAVVMTVASPHLGVRSFGMYRFAPRELHFMAQFVAGKTGMEMMLQDCDEESNDTLLERMSRNTDGLPFLDSLKAFDRRILYANVQNDLLVPIGTAALDPSTTKMNGPWQVPPNAEIIDESHDESGCRVWYRTETLGPVVSSDDCRGDDPENGMAARLRSVGWSMVAIDFRTPIPIAHNRIVAMTRNPVEEYLNRPGKRAVAHMISNLVGEEIECQ